MHLKLDTSCSLDDGDVARDLGQASAEIVVLSAADSDLAAFAAAYATLPAGFPSVRLTNMLALGHPASVDLYVERTLAEAKVVLLRMLGGEGYWPHGVESLRSDAIRRGALFACIPGEMEWSPSLARAVRWTARPRTRCGAIAAKAASTTRNSRCASLPISSAAAKSPPPRGRCPPPASGPPRPLPAIVRTRSSSSTARWSPAAIPPPSPRCATRSTDAASMRLACSSPA